VLIEQTAKLKTSVVSTVVLFFVAQF